MGRGTEPLLQREGDVSYLGTAVLSSPWRYCQCSVHWSWVSNAQRVRAWPEVLPWENTVAVLSETRLGFTWGCLEVF